ncbi:MAG: TonB-dependent receptor [Elusimicrobiota bacterium]|jgi:iron complex outermembrane receptor protein
MLNKREAAFVIGILLSGPAVLSARAGVSDEDIRFFEDEARVITASRLPQTSARLPATVYVLTAEEIRASGAQTLWDAFRSLPGVDVVQTQTSQGEVGVRGMAKPLNNRTLILLDGRTVLNGFFDFVTWEALPVTLEEIERIEVVAGPASALYGANAVSGVINIVTKSPERLGGGQASYSFGERRAHLGSLVYGGRQGDFSYKGAGSWRSTHRFEDASRRASEVGKAHVAASWRFSEEQELGFSGGGANLDVLTNTGGGGTGSEDGQVHFARVDYRLRGTRVRGFWNRGRTVLHTQDESNLDYDTVDFDIHQTFELPWSNSLVVGGGYRNNAMSSRTFLPVRTTQDLWNLYFEDRWEPWSRWTFLASGRIDRHPYSGRVFSPRGSAVFEPRSGHILRFSAATSFRNPTLAENYLNSVRTSPAVAPGLVDNGFTDLEATTIGARDLKPEKATQFELSYQARVESFQVSLTGFHYRIQDFITTTVPLEDPAGWPLMRVRSSYTNRGQGSGWGGELGVEYRPKPEYSAFANYSYQCLVGDLESTIGECGGPRSKANAGLRARKDGWSGSLWANWVGATYWHDYDSSLAADQIRRAKVADYLVMNLHLEHAFKGRLKGLSAGVSAFNFLDRKHYELTRYESPVVTGQNGVLVRSRWIGTLAYRF